MTGMTYRYCVMVSRVAALLLFILLTITPYPLLLTPEVHAAPLTDESPLNLQKEVPQQTKDEGGLLIPFAKLFTGLAVVVGVMLIAYSFAKGRLEKAGIKGGKGKLINVVASHYLAPKKAIMVIEVAGEYMVVGVGEEINLLARIGDIEQGARGKEQSAKTDFSEYLKTASVSEGSTGVIESIKESIERLKGRK